DKALHCQKCEHTFCNTPCVFMEQVVSACGVKGNALLVDCRPRSWCLSTTLRWCSSSNVKHSLSG
ncbi:MAG: hypothetical protein SGPRY_015038, partial [Prymnesium sp.]